ncbi:MAG: FAD-dependent oxidoreductase [Pseudomonadota bacterium]
MNHTPSPTPSYDLVVVGGGIVGLWVARKAILAGLRVALVERARCGSAASATPLGALMPHLPGRLDAKKDFQLQALLSLPAALEQLTADTGCETGYRSTGRMIPIRKTTFQAKLQSGLAEARLSWPPSAQVTANWSIEPQSALPDGWLAPEAAPLGVLTDMLSAAVDARLLTTALRTFISERADLYEGTEFAVWDPDQRRAIDRNGRTIAAAENCVITAGIQSFELLDGVVGQRTGDGVKGHAARLILHPDDALQPGATLPPILYDNGTYVIARTATDIAVGATTEYRWTSPGADSSVTDTMVASARALCPRLARATVTEIWAGLRPRAATRNPLVGPIETVSGLHVATGGYKISFGIAHRLADAFVSDLCATRSSTAPTHDCGTRVRLPDAFKPT